jgi:dihydrofolate synthase / folylpolyglutamate synthase
MFRLVQTPAEPGAAKINQSPDTLEYLEVLVNQPFTLTTPTSARDAALDWLMGRINYERALVIPYQERQLKLDRMRQLLTRLGQPDGGLKIIHVAGTKGKGSASAMIAAILTAAGYRTGVFSSPHLERIEERFSVDGLPCTSDELVALVDRMRPIVAAMDEEAARDGDPTGGPTYFDITTAVALVHFVEQQVDAAVLEVGLGGRLDSTNVCLPAVCVITSISFDHTRQLGNTLAAIAREKAGIIKPGVPVVCGVVEPEPQAVIAAVAREHGCRLIQVGTDFGYQYDPRGNSINFDYAIPSQEHHITHVPVAMPGAHQAANAAVALATIAELRHQGWCVSNDAMRMGLATARLPGRVEVIGGDPEIVLDTAHNAASARALVDALGGMSTPSRRTLILSISSDKDVAAIVRELAPYFDRFIVTQYQENPRATPAEKLSRLLVAALLKNQPFSRDATAERVELIVSAEDSNKCEAKNGASPDIAILPTPQQAWRHVIETSIPGERICITGSFFLAAEMRRLVLDYATSANPGR